VEDNDHGERGESITRRGIRPSSALGKGLDRDGGNPDGDGDRKRMGSVSKLLKKRGDLFLAA